MSCSESSVTKKAYGSTSDIISSLPDALLENILTRMSLRDAVRTSVLSKRWRYAWATLQQLVFDNTLFKMSPQNGLVERNKILIILYQVLYRIKTLRKFCLSSILVGGCPEIDNLIIHLASAQIEEFTLHICQGGYPHKLPLSLFSYQKLSHLDIFYCELWLPAKFRGFSMLVSLELVEVVIAEHTFWRLISSCPLLENLKFVTYMNAYYRLIEIDNPSLKMLEFSGTFRSICFKNAPRLAAVSLGLKTCASLVEPNKEDTCFSNLPALENLENLDLDVHYMMSLRAAFASKLPYRRHLKILKLRGVSLDILIQNNYAIWLMLPPKLQILRIEVSRSVQLTPIVKYPKVWPKICFRQLRDVYVDFLRGTWAEIEFLKFILTQSPVLERMVIKPHRAVVDKGIEILKELSDCKHLSPKAKIII